MNEEQTALARRAVVCPKWRWMPGMLAVDLQTRSEARVMQGTTDLIVRYLEGDRYAGGSVPALSDPATLGCLLALVREAWGDECVCVLPVDYGLGGVAWFCRLTVGGRDLAQSYVGEAEALVYALEAAP